MKTISTLKKLIDFYFYFLALGFIIWIIVIPIMFKTGKFNTLDFLDDHDISNLSFGRFMMMILVGAILYYYFLKAIYLLKKSLNDLCNGNYFSELVISNFNEIGKSFLICGIGAAVFKFILRLVFLSDIKLGIDNFLIISIIIGLFFMFLSEVFIKARKAQQENNLTI
ncbi:DUF2975 domain-containing protein [Flavivirga algicola]|uniref:DUF2975 domain-containing protein n=1 Tax=Flavivirga algicola TaxID=2729136 RepID=A0ABX1RYZ5_9FLAO|nr:DUF2975 domain-containing protein [Flavivirga algicola]NMH87424.1 DUF2975 domain-containing protein [Flavivirga algicola]